MAAQAFLGDQLSQPIVQVGDEPVAAHAVIDCL